MEDRAWFGKGTAHMSTEVWRVVTDVRQAATVTLDFDAPGGLGETAQQLHLPDTLVTQLQQAIGAALRRVAERDQHGQLIVSARASVEDGRAGQSWGFFLVEQPPHEAQPHCIEVFIYQERAPDEAG